MVFYMILSVLMNYSIGSVVLALSAQALTLCSPGAEQVKQQHCAEEVGGMEPLPVGQKHALSSALQTQVKTS